MHNLGDEFYSLVALYISRVGALCTQIWLLDTLWVKVVKIIVLHVEISRDLLIFSRDKSPVFWSMPEAGSGLSCEGE